MFFLMRWPFLLLRRWYRRGIHWCSPNSFWKLCYRQPARDLTKEFAAQQAFSAQYAQQVWGGFQLVFNHQAAELGPLTLVRGPRVRGRAPTSEEVVSFAGALLRRAVAAALWRDWHEVQDPEALARLQRLRPDLWSLICDGLAGVRLPITGAHGDLTYKNIMVCDEGRIFIIDWEHFYAYGSAVQDVCRLLWREAVRSVRGEAGRYKPGDMDIVWASGLMSAVSDYSPLRLEQALLLGAMSQVLLEERPEILSAFEKNLQFLIGKKNLRLSNKVVEGIER